MERKIVSGHNTPTDELYFDSVEDQIRKVSLQPSQINYDYCISERFRSGHSSPEMTDTKRWIGADADYKGVLKIIRDGFPDGLRRIDRILDTIRPLLPPVESIRRQRCYRDTGDYLDLQKVYSGGLDRAWQSTRRAPAS
jgi:hypothetical protein